MRAAARAPRAAVATASSPAHLPRMVPPFLFYLFTALAAVAVAQPTQPAAPPIATPMPPPATAATPPPLPSTPAPIASPFEPVDETDVWWDAATVASLSRSVVRLRPAGRGLLIDDAAAGVAPMAAGVLLKAGYDGLSGKSADAAAAVTTNTTSPLPRFIVTTWRAVNPGFTSYTVDTADGISLTATLIWYDVARPVAVLALDADVSADIGADVNAALAGIQTTDPTLNVGLLGEGEDGSPPPNAPSTPPNAWVAFVGHVQDADAPLPRADGVPSPIRNVRCVISRSLLANRPRLGAGGGVFDASGRLVGLDLEDDLAVAGVSGYRPETHALTAAYVAAAVRDAVTVWKGREAVMTAAAPPPAITPTFVHRGDIGVTWHAVPVGVAITHYKLPAAVAHLLTPPGYDGADGPGGPPRVLIVGSVDADAPSPLRPGDVLVSVDDAGLLGDDFLALDASLTAALPRGAATLVVSRHGTPLTLTVPVSDVEARATTRVATFGGCTFQEVSVAAARRYQLPARGVGVLVSTCEGATGVPAGAGGGAKSGGGSKDNAPQGVVQGTETQGAVQGTETQGAIDVGGLVEPSPLLTMLARSADMQAPPLPALIVGVGATRVSTLDEFMNATRAAVTAARGTASRPRAALPLVFAFTGVHVGNSRGYSMVDGAAVPPDAATVAEYVLDSRGVWVKRATGAAAALPPRPPATPDADTDELPTLPTDVVRRTPPRVGRGHPAKPAPGDRGDDAPVAARRPGSAPGWPAAVGGGGGGDVAGVVTGDDAVGDDDAADTVQAVLDTPAPATLAPLVDFAARVLGKRTIQASGVWSQPQLASMKRAVVSILMHEAVPLENYGPSPSSAGSGFLVDGARGIIATNAHVAGAFAGGWEVTFFDGTVAEARSIWYSPQQDIAFLKVDPAAVPWPDAQVRLASWTSFPADDVTSAAEFSPVVAIGNPARFPFTAMQGAYIGPSYRTNEAIGGTRERNVLNWKAVMQSAGGASGSPVFNANASVVGALFAGGDTSDPRFAGGPWKTEAVMVAADYVKDALDDGVRALTWPARGATGLELDLVPLSTARAYYGLGKTDLEELRAADAAAPSTASPINGPAAPLRPRDRVIVVAGVEPGAPTAAAAAAAVVPGDVLWAVNGALLGGDMRAFERALHGAVGATVNVTLVRRGARVAATLPVYDMTADRTVRYAAWAGGVFHDVSDRTRYTYRIPASQRGVFLSYATNGSPWPHYDQHDARFASKSMVFEVDGVPTPSLDALIAVACAIQSAPATTLPTPGTLVARDVQDDGAPGGDAFQTYFGPDVDGVRVFAWDRAALRWRQQPDPCAL